MLMSALSSVYFIIYTRLNIHSYWLYTEIKTVKPIIQKEIQKLDGAKFANTEIKNKIAINEITKDVVLIPHLALHCMEIIICRLTNHHIFQILFSTFSNEKLTVDEVQIKFTWVEISLLGNTAQYWRPHEFTE